MGQSMKMPKRSLGQFLMDQWPFALGMALIGAGVLCVWHLRTHPNSSPYRASMAFFVIGFALLVYWSNNDHDR